MHSVASGIAGVTILVGKDGSKALLSATKDIIVPKYSQIGGIGGASLVVAGDEQEGIVDFAFPDGDKTIVQFEPESGAVETMTLYALIRKLEALGKTNIGMSHHKLERPAARAPGERDKLEVICSSAHQFQVKKNDREAQTHKTIFAVHLKRAKLMESPIIIGVPRLRFESVGKNLKPTKPHIVTKAAITLVKGKPKLIYQA